MLREAKLVLKTHGFIFRPVCERFPVSLADFAYAFGITQQKAFAIGELDEGGRGLI
jgi:hypothetical protein